MPPPPEPTSAPARTPPWTRSAATPVPMPLPASIPGPAELAAVVGDPRRLAAVRDTHLVDAPAAPAVGRLVALAARLLRAPTALLTIVDGDRDVVKAHIGLPDAVAAAGEVRAFPSFCQIGIARHHALSGPPSARPADAVEGIPTAGTVLVVGDVHGDPVFGDAFAELPSVAGMGVRACVTAPLLNASGQGVGSLCAVDFAAREWTADEVATLSDLATAAAGEIALHATIAALGAANKRLQDQAAELALQAALLEERQEELRQTNVRLRLAAAEAEAANAAKSQFLTTMSHELRTPLNAIGGYAELIAMGIRGPVSDEQQHDLARIQASQQHLISLITDILNFAKIEAGQVEVRREAVDVAAALAGAEDLVAPQVAARGLALTVAAPEGALYAAGDAERVRQILLNLLTNALKFTDAGGRLELAAVPDGGLVRVSVRDTGRGIAPAQLERVFEPFVQLDRHLTRQSQQGVGLGLAISRELARAMGGDLAVESRLGEGSRFTLTLPRASPPPPGPPPPEPLSV